MNTLKNATFNEGFILSSRTKYSNNQYAIQIYTKLTQNKQRINKKNKVLSVFAVSAASSSGNLSASESMNLSIFSTPSSPKYMLQMQGSGDQEEDFPFVPSASSRSSNLIFVPNCHKKTSSLKTHPPKKVEMTFYMAVWVWMPARTSLDSVILN